TGAATVSLARVMANVGDKKARFPEDGKGYYIYVFDNGYGGGLLEAVAETVIDHTTDIPTIEKGQYSKDITYIADLDAGIAKNDLNWDLLYDAYSDNGVIYGTATNESGIYGVGFRHATYGRGKSEISFKLTIPDYVTEYVSVAMRLNSYHDLAVDQTGIRVYINSKGEIGLKFSGTSQDLTTRATGFSFAEGRNVYITDDAENNVITVYFDDNGTRVKVAEVAINRGTATLTPADTTLTAVTKNYGYNIYTDGYISITTDGADVLIGELMATVQTFSNKAFARAVDTIVGGGSTPEEDKEAEKDPSDSSTPSNPSAPSDTSKPSTPSDTSKPAAPSDTSSKPSTTVTPDTDDTSSDTSSDVDSDADTDKDDDTDKDANTDADDTPQDGGVNLWLIIAILGGAVLLGTFIVIFALKSTKKKEA
ncbi:MAG: hypothetical protein IJD10_02925, partial [Clostridia bacterium]|nr:hypothetical protein [Clostridia bacterium]